MNPEIEAVELFLYDRDPMILDSLIGYGRISIQKILSEAPLQLRISLSIPEKSLIPLNIPVIHPQKFQQSTSEIIIGCAFLDSEQKFNVEEHEKMKCDIRKRKKELQKLFNVNEDYIKDFSCALEKNILHWGRLFVTETYILFNSPFKKKVIALDAIRIIERCKMAKMFNTGASIIYDGKKVTFKSFKHRSEFIDLISQLLEKKGKDVQIVDQDDISTSIDEDYKLTDSELDSSTPETPKLSNKWRKPFKSLVSIKNKLFSTSSNELSTSDVLSKSCDHSSESSGSDERVKEEETSIMLKNSLLMGDMPLVSGEEEVEDANKHVEKSDSTLAYTAEEDFNLETKLPTEGPYIDKAVVKKSHRSEKLARTSRRRSLKRRKQGKSDSSICSSSVELITSSSLHRPNILLTMAIWIFKTLLFNLLLSIATIPFIYGGNLTSSFFFAVIITLLSLLAQAIIIYIIRRFSANISHPEDIRQLLKKFIYTWTPLIINVILQTVLFIAASKITHYLLQINFGDQYSYGLPIHVSVRDSYAKICIVAQYIFSMAFTFYVMAENFSQSS